MVKTVDGGVILNHRESFYLASALQEIIKYESVENEFTQGLWLHKTWLTPETCYHIANLLEIEDGCYEYWEKEINILRNGDCSF